MAARNGAMVRGGEEPAGVARARAIARMLDAAVRVPGIGTRFGLDAVLGLVPGLGDVAGAALSGYVVILAARMGAPASVVGRMLGNVAVDTLVGTVPVLGDLFDIGWKSNTRNVALLDGYLERPHETKRSSRMVMGLVLLALVALAAFGVAVAVFVVRGLASVVS
ncbi:MAG TPA: DUF4112 domain-containing protein [Longimicrobiaceae bacterium]|nr:DUF4112 domain-containing protein [Longimicrobiaceae bacterium]